MRRKPLKRVNPERRARNFAKHYLSEEYVWWIHSLPCLGCGGGRGDIHAAHVRSRGAGGTWRDIIPLCADCHHTQHTQGWGELESLYGLTKDAAAAEAAQLAAEWGDKWTTEL